MKTEHIMRAIKAVEMQMQYPLKCALVGQDGDVMYVAMRQYGMFLLYHVENIDGHCPAVRPRGHRRSMDDGLFGGLPYQAIHLDNPSPEDLSELLSTYAARQARWIAANRITIGSRLRVLAPCADDQWGWGNDWNEFMDEYIGRVFVVNSIRDRSGIELGNWWFPYFVLEPAC